MSVQLKKRKTLTAEERRQISITNMENDEIRRGAGGRPTTYTLELAKEICDAVARCTLSMTTLVKANQHWPERETIALWRVRHEEFYLMYMQAKQAQCDLYAEECVDISDSENLEATMRDNLRVSTRKWFVSKLAPKLYGDKVVLEDSSGKEEVIKTTQKKLEKALLKRKSIKK